MCAQPDKRVGNGYLEDFQQLYFILHHQDIGFAVVGYEEDGFRTVGSVDSCSQSPGVCGGVCVCVCVRVCQTERETIANVFHGYLQAEPYATHTC